jgi:hypothetical protein
MKKLFCKIKGHQFVSLKRGDYQIKEYKCSCCKQKYTEDGYGQIVKLTKYWETNNMLFEQHFRNRTAV